MASIYSLYPQQPVAYSADPLDYSTETEEERRKRLAREAGKPVSTQTVETMPDGTQVVKTEEQVPAQTAQPEVYSTGYVGGAPYGAALKPIVPVEAKPYGPVEEVNLMPDTRAVPEPIMPAPQGSVGGAPYPVTPEAPMMPAPQGSVGGAPYPVTPEAAAAAAPAAQYSLTAAPAMTDSSRYIQDYQSVQDDPLKLLALRNDENAPEFIRNRAGDQAYRLMDAEIKKKEAAEQAKKLGQAAAQGDRAASNIIARTLQSQEGSWLKMMLLGFISPEMAGEEAIKLGFGNKWQPAMNSAGDTGLIEYNAKGMPIRGQKADGTLMNEKELIAYASYGTAAKGLSKSDVSTQDVERNGAAGRVVTQHLPNGKTKTMVESGGKYYEYDSSWKSRSIGTSFDKRQNELYLKLQYAGPEKVATIVAEDEAVNGPLDPRVKANILARSTTAAPNMPRFATPNAGAPAQTQAPAPAQTQAPATAPAPGTAPSMAPTAATRQTAPTVPATPSAPSMVPTAGAAPGMTPPPAAGGGTIAQRRAAAEAAATKAKKVAEETGTDVGKITVNQPKIEQNADYLVTKIDELIQHPGFERSVGLKGPGTLFGMRETPIAGTIEADWDARFKETQGRTFLEAFESLRGGGQITEKEGEKATAALNRMSTSISEEEFRAAAEDFKEVVKRSVDRNRKKLGQPPIYDVEEESRQTTSPTVKPLSGEDRRALEWARNNPNDPRAAAIKQRLGL